MLNVMLITVSLFNTMLALKKLSLRASALKCQGENDVILWFWSKGRHFPTLKLHIYP